MKPSCSIYLFFWYGINNNGFIVKGECFGNGILEIQSFLRSEDIVPIKIKKKINFLSKNNITKNDITEFSREIYTLISAGIPLSNALDIVANSLHKSSMRALVKFLKNQVDSGSLFSQALRSSTNYFDEIFCSLIHAAEQSGRMDVILRDITTYREKIESLRLKIKKSLYYPMVVFLISLAVTATLLIVVIPQFSTLFESVGAQLPVYTQMIIYVSNYLSRYGWILLLFVLCACIMIKFLIKYSRDFNFLFDKVLLKIPLVGNLIKKMIFTRCFKNLSVTLTSGLPLLDAIDLASKISGNKLYCHAFSQILEQVRAGQSIYASFRNMKVFPTRVIEMIAIGEESGCLDEMFNKLGIYFEEQIDYFMHHLNQLLEPVIMIFLCLLVGGLVIAMYLPIFRLGSVV